MRTITDIQTKRPFYITAYKQEGIHAEPAMKEFIIDDSMSADFLFFLKNNNTTVLAAFESDLQTLCTKNDEPLLSAGIDANLALEFVHDAMLLAGGFKGKGAILKRFYELRDYIAEAIQIKANLIYFEGHQAESLSQN